MDITNAFFRKYESKKQIDVCDLDQFKREFEALLEFPLLDVEAAKEFQQRRDLLEKHYVNEWAESHFLTTRDTSSREFKERMKFCEGKIVPLYEEFNDKLNEKFLIVTKKFSLDSTFEHLKRKLTLQREIHCEENIEINTKILNLCSENREICGGKLAEFRGQKIPLSQLQVFKEDRDRETRKEAYLASIQASEKVCDRLNKNFDNLYQLRLSMAQNLGFETFTKYRFKELNRVDWNEEDCFSFHDAVKKYFVPLLQSLDQERMESLNIDSLFPYDLKVDYLGRDPLLLYEKGQEKELIRIAREVIANVDSELLSFFDHMNEAGFFDLGSRPNKAPGGYMLNYPVYEQASIFWNATGTSLDLMVFLHELGHCFHYFLGSDVFPFSLQDWTAEVAEGGSMSMEYIGLENMSGVIGDEIVDRMIGTKLRATVELFVSCSRGDEFQHWMYSHPGHTVSERSEKWIELSCEYRPELNSELLERESRVAWQFEHILNLPFYYIDYSISELLALNVWDRYQKNREEGLDLYKKGCSLAASKSVPEIYKSFGAQLDFGESAIAPVAKSIQSLLKIK